MRLPNLINAPVKPGHGAHRCDLQARRLTLKNNTDNTSGSVVPSRASDSSSLALERGTSRSHCTCAAVHKLPGAGDYDPGYQGHSKIPSAFSIPGKPPAGTVIFALSLRASHLEAGVCRRTHKSHANAMHVCCLKWGAVAGERPRRLHTYRYKSNCLQVHDVLSLIADKSRKDEPGPGKYNWQDWHEHGNSKHPNAAKIGLAFRPPESKAESRCPGPCDYESQRPSTAARYTIQARWQDPDSRLHETPGPSSYSPGTNAHLKREPAFSLPGACNLLWKRSLAHSALLPTPLFGKSAGQVGQGDTANATHTQGALDRLALVCH